MYTYVTTTFASYFRNGNAQEFLNIPYWVESDNTKPDSKHHLDVFVPVSTNEEEVKRATKNKVFVFVHGGGWARGDRRW